MLYQEVTLWDARRVKEKSRYTEGPRGILSLVSEIDKQVAALVNKSPARQTSRAKRELDLAKQAMLIEDFRHEQDGLAMLYQDGESTRNRYHEIRTFQVGITTHLTVPKEMRTSTLLNKYEQRLTGYTCKIVQALHDRKEHTIKVGNERGKRLWEIEQSIAKVVSRRSKHEPLLWPRSADLVEIMVTLELIEHEAAILMSISKVPDIFKTELQLVTDAYRIVTKVLMLLRDWPDEDEMDIVLIQWFRAYRAVLSSGALGLGIA